MTRRDFIAINIVSICSAVLAVPVLANVGARAGSLLFYAVFVIGVAAGADVALWVAFWLARWKPAFAEIAKFGAVGVLNTLIDFGILNFLSFTYGVYSGGVVAIFNVIGFSIAVVNSYFWNKYWTFGGKAQKKIMEFIKFLAVSVAGIVINTLIVYVLTTFAGIGDLSPSQWENIAKLVATLVSLAWTFWGYKHVVFRHEGA